MEQTTVKINITKVKKSRVTETDMKNLNFGEVFSDHMLMIDYTDGKWQTPQIVPFGDISFPPSICAIHYGQVIFEGLKAFYTKQGKNQYFPPAEIPRTNEPLSPAPLHPRNGL
jgi:branched-chain amino acid aminotransferase